MSGSNGHVDTSGHSPVDGRRALVTGAASGIGLAVARHLGSRGARVVLTDLPGERLDGATASVPGGVAVAADLGVRAEVHHLADEVGDVDILVNNAGLQHVSAVEQFDEARWALLLEVMLTSPFVLIRRLLPGMYERGWGRIVNIASVHGLVASPYKSAYVSAKHGIVGLTKTVALEAAARCPDVTVHAVCPSYVRSPLVEGQIADQARIHDMAEDEVLEKVLLTRNAVRRLIEPEQIAESVEFLCGRGAWSMTGGVLSLDAGWLAH
ncbi:MAG TPA: 3-hydroxybutyrate dehydrogenase [Candidatus Dormibacteraeota bacterium]|jgi:3-hydroxybutyrate dehydrogenase|nr:3-hydroxybutyrate dehydrogenase [Candidatus Dormibacteraeota bacterium]